MYNNPDEIISDQPTEPSPLMEGLQPNPMAPQAYPVHTPLPDENVAVVHPGEQVEAMNTRERVKFAIGKVNDYLLWFLMVLETMLIVRFLLKLIGADPANLFAGFLYALTDVLLFPFLGIVKSPSIHPPNQSFEFSTLIAAIIYYLIFYALRRFFRILVSNPEEPVE